MKAIVIIMWCLLFSCSAEFTWRVEMRPETVEERKAVTEHAQQVLSKIPATVSGHDQDWDDAIFAAHKSAVECLCKRRLYEYVSTPGNPMIQTGKMKECEITK